MSPIARWFEMFAGLVGAAVADRRGATAIEYALIAASVGVAVATTVWGVGSSLQTNFYDKLLNLL